MDVELAAPDTPTQDRLRALYGEAEDILRRSVKGGHYDFALKAANAMHGTALKMHSQKPTKWTTEVLVSASETVDTLNELLALIAWAKQA